LATIKNSPDAFGAPGIAPRWTRGAKEVVGTAYSTSSRIWFTVSGGILSEIYYPTIDRPQVRDLQYLVTDGQTFLHDTRRHLHSVTEYIGKCGLGARIVNADPDGRYKLIHEVIADPHQPCLLINTLLQGDPQFLSQLRLYVLLAPHLEVGGSRNNANLAEIPGKDFLTAHKDRTWLALAANVPFKSRSCGYVGVTDGWQDLAGNFKMDYEFAAASDGNVALTAELDLRNGHEFTLGLAFGHSLHRAVTTLFQSLGTPFPDHRARLLAQWNRVCSRFSPEPTCSGDHGALYHRSRELLLAHEDKSYPGAFIASLSIPWGETRGDEDVGGYHLVWTRDMVNCASALLAAGDATTPLRALIYLACSQQPDGGFPQNFWIDGEPNWRGIQLDEVAYPISLAWRLHKARALQDFDPYPMVRMAARYLVVHGPATPQERWEENSGYSPSTLAGNIAALVCAAAFARERGDLGTASFLEDYADFLDSHVEAWTVTKAGTLVPGIARHYVRINPCDMSASAPDEDSTTAWSPSATAPPELGQTSPLVRSSTPGFLNSCATGSVTAAIR
jgi:glucoamylase